MIFTDTSVWIDFFADQPTSEVKSLVSILESEESICFTGLVIQEIFQGVKSEKKREIIEIGFAPLIEIFPNRETYKLAAELYRVSRSKGHQIRSSVDCLIAACCIEHNLELLAKDRDFKYIAQISNLKLHP